MDRKRKLATAGAISLTATAAVVALGASVGLFGLTDDSPRVGKLSPIDSTQTTTATTPDDIQTIIVEDPAPAAPNGAAGTVTTTPRHTEPGDDRGNDGFTSPATTGNTLPQADDHDDDHDNSGPGSTSSGHDDDDHDDNSGPGSTSSGHDDDDD
jgi:hypothetical protein